MKTWKKNLSIISGLIGLLSGAAALFLSHVSHDTFVQYPGDWFYNQRAFPSGEIDFDIYMDAKIQAKTLKKRSAANTGAWIFAGPTNIGGRLSDVELSPTSFDTIYIGAASGGVFKSVDRGETWTPVFDDALSLSIGDIALDPSDPNVVYVGTGEVNCGGGSTTYGGMGVYKSTDGGGTWSHLGLEDTRYIARIVVNPDDPQTIFVAAMGKLYAENPERGLYRTTNGGTTWEKVLYISEGTGCVDLVINPDSTSVLYAAMWERIRHPGSREYGGDECGLYRSTDGGDSWHELTNGLPNGTSDLGRIGISLCASDPSILYAVYADKIGYFDGVYKTTDGGDSWIQTNDNSLSSVFSSYGWWFGNIRVDPVNPDNVFVLGLTMYRTTDGGQNWAYVSSGVHVDHHGMYIHPQDPDFIVLGNDGGLYISSDGGANNTWTKKYNMPVTQFYTCEVDYQNPERLYGGTQDNGTRGTKTGSLDDWEYVYGGDGFYVLVDPTDNRYVYAESQYGNLRRSTDGGSSFSSGTNGISSSDRSNWNSPLAMDPSNPAKLYFGTQRLYRSTNRAVSWTAISGDLTDGPHSGNVTFGTITTIAVAPSDDSVIYVGTDDGVVSVTLNGGSSWSGISGSLPVRWITRVAVDPYDSRTAYVTISGFKEDDYLPHIFRTTDAGGSWQDISGSLPEVPLNDVIVDPGIDSTLYIAGDVGVFKTSDLGATWEILGEDLPDVPVTDLVLHDPTRTLIAATFGRSMYKIVLEPATSVPVVEPGQNPGSFRLHQNFPNPFNPVTTISFEILRSSRVSLQIFDALGRVITTLTDRQLSPGEHTVQWDGTNNSGMPVSGGVYFCRMTAGDFTQTKKMVLIK
ncbi:FlgD immunoglobulin-like domain containing protein [candidate division KSB1 bacterium]